MLAAFESLEIEGKVACELNWEAFPYRCLHHLIVLTLPEQLHDARAVHLFERSALFAFAYVNCGLA